VRLLNGGQKVLATTDFSSALMSRERRHYTRVAHALCIGATGRTRWPQRRNAQVRLPCTGEARVRPRKPGPVRSLPRNTVVTSAPVAAARLPLGSACGGSRFAVVRCGSLQLKVCRLGGVEAVVLAMHMHTGDRL
jgi:hypothetical protein